MIPTCPKCGSEHMPYDYCVITFPAPNAVSAVEAPPAPVHDIAYWKERALAAEGRLLKSKQYNTERQRIVRARKKKDGH